MQGVAIVYNIYWVPTLCASQISLLKIFQAMNFFFLMRKLSPTETNLNYSVCEWWTSLMYITYRLLIMMLHYPQPIMPASAYN